MPEITACRHPRIQLSDREIVQKKQRSRALHSDVVHTVIHQVLTHCVVAAGKEGDFSLVPTPSAELTSTGLR